MHNKICSLLLAAVLPVSLHAQLSVETSGMTILSGTTLSADQLVLVPSSDLTLTSTVLTRTATPVVGTSGATSIGRVFNFSSPVVYNGNAGFFYNISELGTNTEALMQVAFTSAAPGSTWTQWTTTTGSTVNTGSSFISQDFAGTTLGRVTSTSSALPLPLHLLAFNAEKGKGRTAVLNWTVTEEGFVPVYQLERSRDGRTFELIGAQKGIGNGTQQYAFTDISPAEGNNYYRLLLTDENGGRTYSNVSVLQFSRADAASVAPNPFDQSFVVSAPDAALVGTKAVLTDLSGKVIRQVTLSSNAVQVNTAGLASGLYVLTFENGTAIKMIKK
ncbi:T9SS type A sorting domain-containing protein [Edaphocola aurantiacus]|uniref:T9SS type A sorting domain-containing protein n=1 Tax=Edaphocola aurantiacus TaxID=2601682 RepID=UPI001C974AC8|nr:T9SS type A sorting domain-containing protein [Edaphocola aurantiacus]